MGAYISYLFVDSADLPQNIGGFIQLMFLMACYSFFLYQGSHLISDGSELLLLVPSIAGIVGSVVLPVLGAVPDGAIVLFSGLGDDAQNQLTVGVGALAGSTVMLLTLPWAMCIFAGRVDLDKQGNPVYRKPAGAPANWTKLTPGLGWRHALFGSGIPIGQPMRINAFILAFTSLAYLIIQVPGFTLGCGKGMNCSQGAKEKYWALGGFFFATISFICYLIYQVKIGGEEEHYQDKLTQVVSKHIGVGHVGVADAFFAFLHTNHHLLESDVATTTSSAPSKGLLANEAQSSAASTYGAGGDARVNIGGSGESNKSEATIRTERKMRPMLKRFFKVYDRDANGGIDLAELTLLLKDIGQRSLSTDAIKTLFTSMDVSGDGAISFHEFADSMFLILEHPSLAGRLETAATVAKAEAKSEIKSAAVIGSDASAEAKHASRGQSMANLSAILSGFGADGAAAPASSASSVSHSLNGGYIQPSSPNAAPQDSHGQVVGLRPLAHDGSEEDEEEDEVEEEEEVPEDLASLGPEEQQKAIKLRATWMMSLGTALILLFSDPMVDCLSQVGDRTGIPAFYVAFLLAPLAANASELLAAVNYASKKTPASITISLTSLEGSAAMNNTFCLLIFLMLVFAKDLIWEFSAETIAILVVEMAVACMTFKKVHTGLDAIILLSLYPLSMGLVALLENAAGLN